MQQQNFSLTTIPHSGFSGFEIPAHGIKCMFTILPEILKNNDS